MQKIRAGLIGISGYGGMELASLMSTHPSIELTMACSRAEAGRKLGDFYPFLRHLPGSDLEISVYEPELAIERCDIVFMAVPAGTAMKMAPALLEKGIKVVDFSADFRLHDPAVYEEWYKQPHIATKYLPKAVYGLPELYYDEIAKADLIANPGCYPTASILGLYAALKYKLIDPDSIIIDAKSGASGAGRKAVIPNLFCEISENFRPYGVPGHRHTPEIEQELGRIAGMPLCVTFTPHLLPIKRGIICAMYAKIRRKDIDLESIHEIYRKTWNNSHWVRVLPLGELPSTASVNGSMFCDISVALDKRTDRLLVFSAIDNLCRGASGQALANANLMCGLPADEGMISLAPLP